MSALLADTADLAAGRQNVIQLVGVTKSYKSIDVLSPVNLDIRDGEFLTILGPSGSGKTTILRMIGGFTPPTAGKILLRGTDIAQVPIHKRPFNTVFQDYALFPHMTVARNVGYGLRIRKTPAGEIKRRVEAVLGTVNLGDKAGRYPAELSGGQRQRVALARAIVCEPQVILLDEPLAALDAELRRSMQEFLKELQRRIRTTFVFITHDQEEAISMSDRIAVMDHGNLVQVGTPQEIYYKPKSEFVAKFFGENNILPAAASGLPPAPSIESPLGRHAATAGQHGELLLAIRPESLRLYDGSDLRSDERIAKARLESITFLGASTQLSLSVGASGEHRVKVRVPTALSTRNLAAGNDVMLRWSEADVSFLPRG
ncbi:ABC transporter ATP-binding protein [Rhizobium ruizarguesonis]|uniref:ABC transporter ATP-binding protein n=1 Tax=Rhizobium ruizarguesonis TaxID=2081791 RepID=UPI00041AED5E|nr:ABC transporter ATP-binding protein [Rhizobium ruizarguesonis]MBY5851611.1 ABC transporter ATP-binding protein [Rhizobium leguminosarum]NKL13374.1 ATP-binding cassette domain-containing protein [Rhizobium leguminosarum bv. viciae]MBY5873386.1 ABC transporter ATP-binding protein [Rhizobium leguminosarum]MBY5892404.1 ABC transporter ATP-binding protein [Rhizobium leguminosarum]NEH38255.1 ATP-binding cassette domain-containing protein [Rhizobium ruizarguesonis]